MATEAPPDDLTVTRRKQRLAYTSWIEQVCAEDPGARVALRSGVGRGIDNVPRMHRLVARWLPAGCSEAEQRAYYAVAAMIADQPRNSYASAAKPDTDTGTDSEPDGEEKTTPPEAAASRKDRYGDSLGAAFALAVTQGPGREREMRESAAESRLNLLTRQSIDGLHRHLPSAVRYLRGVDVPVDWAQLLDDLIAWPVHSGRIARRWLQDYYRARARDEQEKANQADQEDLE
ncbi:type I-E CRISPR-associated protein Cse2/CasB [Streptomyces carminius]|uniref:Type I-E CRISPR-associated protein Cse2/CasB n=1 Tax=Streptomyces carminius TaxID=2665496 RepID=A0A2M8MCN8_9ACTN|nr:type I-E CRISPR-associated protein Cse2/CasB [Streptomyces carminius]PJF01958.1 type I-E CRISPR-associated protein Cse2/CasB [Streptomyces carminius]